MTAPAPSVCPDCLGDGWDVREEAPCKWCRCTTCGHPCEYPPECKECAADEEAAAKRRADR